ncbi:MAG: DNA polymerase I [Candidatus Aminicenantes bacterium]|nr:DNA polymerase I [Candidatus Aminicenantes bacterium]
MSEPPNKDTKDRTKGESLVLIDGNSLLYRSYYAIRFLTNSKGFPTNAIYGFIATLKKLIDQEKPKYLAIVFDTKGPTIRHKLYKEYKAQRKPMPDDLSVQIPVLKKIIKAMNIPLYEFEDFEADDVIGCLAARAPIHGLHSVIVTTDKDLFQLVNDSTTVYNPSKDIYLDEKGVEEFFGVAPSQVVGVLSLWGDPSDNIPGVPGIGEKTAKALIKQFGTLEALLENLERIEKERLREKIAGHIDDLRLSRELATLKTELDLEFNLKELVLSPPNEKELLDLFRELDFSSLISDTMKTSIKPQKEYHTLLDEAQLHDLISEIRKAKCVALDTETDSPFPTQARLVGMSFAVNPHQAYYLPLTHDYPGAPRQIPKDRALSLLESILANPGIKKIGQNIKYDAIVLKSEGIALQGLDKDTMVLSYLLEPNWGKHNLNKLALTYLGVKTISYHDVVGKGKNELKMNSVDIAKATPYACQDADYALQLESVLWTKIREQELDTLYISLEQPLIAILADMEAWGVKVDSRVMKKLSLELEHDLNFLKKNIFSLSGEEFNLNSPQQLASILFDKMGIQPTRRTKKTKSHSTDMGVLQDLAKNHPIAQYTLEYRQLTKLKSTYADALPKLINPKTGRIHTSYNQTVAATGRLSSSDPNLQNIPVRGELGKKCRQAFVPESGYLFLSADYSQIELRVLAHLSGDPALIETFLNDRDVHQDTAERVFKNATTLFHEEQRRRAKIINFSLIYGTSAFSLAKELGTSTAEAQKFIDLYFEKYPKVKEFLEKSVLDAQETGYAKTLFGRTRHVPQLRHENKIIRQAGRRIALNTPIQGTAADLMKKAMIDIQAGIESRKLGSKMILQVHDELVFEVPQEECNRIESLVKEKMENVLALAVPLKVRLAWGINWAEAK